MKNLNKIIIAFLLLSSIAANAQLIFTDYNKLGINRTPSYTLDVEGTVRFSNWTDVIIDWSAGGLPVLYPENPYGMFIGKSDRWLNHLYCSNIDYSNLYKTSDISIKEKIEPLTDILSRIKQLNSYSYYYKDDYFLGFSPEQKLKEQKREFGFIAQELNIVFPELVFKPDSGLMSIDYVSMVPILVQAIKEQQSQIETIQTIVYSQEKELIELKNLIKNLSDEIDGKSTLKSTTVLGNESDKLTKDLNKTELMQNTPNPFSLNTEIKFFLPDDISSAKLIIHDLQGLEIKSYTIIERGFANKIINGAELKAGMYLYTLLIDGKIFDSKRMILTSE
jgi:hypothetical protein